MEVTLKNTSAIAVINSLGAELRSFVDGAGTEYIWQADPAYWAKSSPVLFPIVGALRDGKATIAGKEIEMKKHGFASGMEFRVVYSGDQKAIFALMANEQTKAIYPFDFNFQITYELVDCKLHIRYDVYNMGEEVMPFMIGAHPAFNVPLVQDDSFENYELVFSETETVHSPVYDLKQMVWNVSNRVLLMDRTTKLPLRYELFDNDAILFDEPKSRQVAILSKLTGRGVQMTFDTFNMVAFWTMPGKKAPYLCIEPWCGAGTFSDETDVFEDKRGVQFANPDEKKTYALTIEMM